MGNRSGANQTPGRAGLRRAPRVLVLVATGLAVAMFGVPIQPGTAGAAAPGRLAVRVGEAPDLPAGAAAVSPVASDTALSVDVILQPRDPAGLNSFAQAVSTPGSSQYRHYLRETQFASRFGPTPATVDAVRKSLVDEGLHPGPTSSNGLSIPVRASVKQLSSAFATGFTRYRVHGGRLAFANTAAPRIAGSVAPDVQAVVGLDDLSLAVPAGRPAGAGGSQAVAEPHADSGGLQACATASATAKAAGSYTATQVAADYGFSSLYRQGDLGSGQAVALYELQGFGSGDITTYRSCFHSGPPVTSVSVDGGPLAGSGVGEADVDIEQVLSLAPAVHIFVYQGPNTGVGGYDTYQAIIAQDQAKVVSTSWGLCEPSTGSGTERAEATLFKEAAAQGQTVVAASGDEGSEDCLGDNYSNDRLAVDDPASQPFVTGAGGTSWSIQGSVRTESAWNDGPTCCWGAGGGGLSSLWAMPTYQADSHGIGVVGSESSGKPCKATSGADCREVPDVSALSGSFPYLYFVSGRWGSWGGTSLAAPLWASLIALSNASNSCRGKDIGFAKPDLYDVAAADPSAFHDVTSGNNDLTGKFNGIYGARAGYDMATGLGTPNASVLPAALCAGAAVDPVSVTDPGRQSTEREAPVSLQVRATDADPGRSLSYVAVGLPTGLKINASNGLIAGRPTGWGTYAVFVTARDGTGASRSVAFSWVVTVAITTAASATAAVGTSFTFTVRTTGVPKTITVSPPPPKGLVFKDLGNGTATVSGTVNAADRAGRYPLAIKATFGSGSTAVTATQAFTLTLVDR